MHTFRVWAPDKRAVDVLVGRGSSYDGFERHPMTRTRERGWWEAAVPAAGPGSDYGFSLDGGPGRPDPRSAWQPAGVDGPGRVYDHAAFSWTDAGWRAVPLAGAVLYELHVGTFTLAGTFDAAVDHLDHLVDLGVDAVELLPCNAFSGRHGWGYDGVDLYAVHDPYGGPDGLKRLVDGCHARGLGVVMDVVYNHLGPAGSYLPEFGPYLTDTHQTPWGPAVNLDAPGSDEVRRFIVDNAVMWLRDYHCDGLRLDAVHALVDERATHLLEELAVKVEVLAAAVHRPLFLVAESDLNDPRLVTSRQAGGYGLDAQWCDDVHHSLHALLTGERSGYYADFGSLPGVAKALTSAFVHDGTWSSFRGRSHGRRVDTSRLLGHRFVAYLQDHDQVGNRALGDRLSATLSDGLLRVGAALVLTSAFTPMLFMGEEWGASTPWQFFTSHPDPELGRAVSEGRRREFASHGWAGEEVPDPQDPATREASVLRWDEVDVEPHANLLAWHRALIRLRRACPELTDGRLDRVQVAFDDDARWLLVQRGAVAVACNLAGQPQTVPLLSDGAAEVLLCSVPGGAVVQTDGSGAGAVGTGVALPAQSVAVLAGG